MAKIKFGAIAADARGKLGGIVFSKNSSAAYVRKRTVPVNVNSIAQQASRNDFRTLTQGWKALSQDERQSWNSQSANYPRTNSLGDVVQLTGHQLYMSHNMNLLNAGEAAINIAQPPTEFLDLVMSVTLTIAGNTFDVDHTETDSFTRLVIEATRPMSAGINFVADKDFRKLTSVVTDSGAATSVETFYEDTFGIAPSAMLEGQAVWVRAFFVSIVTGQATAAVMVKAIVAA